MRRKARYCDSTGLASRWGGQDPLGWGPQRARGLVVGLLALSLSLALALSLSLCVCPCPCGLDPTKKGVDPSPNGAASPGSARPVDLPTTGEVL